MGIRRPRVSCCTVCGASPRSHRRHRRCSHVATGRLRKISLFWQSVYFELRCGLHQTMPIFTHQVHSRPRAKEVGPLGKYFANVRMSWLVTEMIDQCKTFLQKTQNILIGGLFSTWTVQYENISFANDLDH